MRWGVLGSVRGPRVVFGGTPKTSFCKLFRAGKSWAGGWPAFGRDARTHTRAACAPHSVFGVRDKINLSAALGVAVCELSFATGEPDYTLFVDGKALGTGKGKTAGHSLVGVEEQSTKYVTGVPHGLPHRHAPLPFCYEPVGEEIRFTNRFNPEPRSRNVFAIHRPETLLAWIKERGSGVPPLT